MLETHILYDDELTLCGQPVAGAETPEWNDDIDDFDDPTCANCRFQMQLVIKALGATPGDAATLMLDLREMAFDVGPSALESSGFNQLMDNLRAHIASHHQ